MKDKEYREDGFTLIELMVVVIIIGIISAITMPMLRENIKTAVQATLIADVREAAQQMEKDSIMSKTGAYAQEISSVYHHSENNNIILVEDDYSDDNSFCIIGRNEKYTDLYSYYSSDERIARISDTPISNCGTGNPYTDGTLGGRPEESPDVSSPEQQPPAPVGYNDSKRKKYNICHNGSTLNLPLPGIVNGHAGHGSDIIPPIPNAYPTGLNWTTIGANTWYNNCKPV